MRKVGFEADIPACVGKFTFGILDKNPYLCIQKINIYDNPTSSSLQR